MPEAAVEAGDGYENELMIGNGVHGESPRTDEEIVLVRNDNWAGDFNGETWPDRAERIEFRVIADPDTSYNALEAGEIDIADPAGAVGGGAGELGQRQLDVNIMGSYHFIINQRSACWR